MLRMDLKQARAGMKLALAVAHPKQRNQVLLRAGYELSDTAIHRLRELQVRLVWVDYPSLAFLDQYINPRMLETQSNLVYQVGELITEIQRGAAAKVPYQTYTATIGHLVADLVENPQAAMFMGDLMFADHGPMLRHSSTVAYLSLLMGLKLEGYLVRQRKHIPPAQAKEVVSLGMGAMLHDVGMLTLPAEVRKRFDETGDDTDPGYREHPSLGYTMIRGKVAPTAATVVLNHHQRVDGSGWAGGDWPALDGDRIHVFARIVGLADAFDRLRHPVVGPERPTIAALQALTTPDGMVGFDPRVVRALFTVVPPFAPGSILKLSDNRWAVATDHNLADPCRPPVQIIADPSSIQPGQEMPEGEPLALSEAPESLRVVECDGQDVSGFHFPTPACMLDESLALAWC